MNIAKDLDDAMRNYVWDGSNPPRIGLTQPELAKLSGVPQPTISRTLKGKSIPETKTLMKLAEALGCMLGGHAGEPAIDGRVTYPNGSVVLFHAKETDPLFLPAPIGAIVDLARAMSPEGRHVLLGRTQELARQYPATKANHSS